VFGHKKTTSEGIRVADLQACKCIFPGQSQILFEQTTHSETNVMHFLFSLLRIKGLYMFRALLAHPQEVLDKLNFVYCMRVMSVVSPDAAN
jgi:hypothetical protein